jgi:hypothetical protein
MTLEEGIRQSGSRERRHNSEMELPRFWIVMQVLIVICVVISMVIAIIKL